GMLRRFAIAAKAVPTDLDAEAVNRDLMNVRLFVGRLSAVRIIVMMAFFEGFIQQFMAFMADLAERQGSAEREYTDVHGVCDVTHTQELYRALAAEMAINPHVGDTTLVEGAACLKTPIQSIVIPVARETNLSYNVRLEYFWALA